MNMFINLEKGSEIVSSIISYCRENKISSACFFAIGAVSEVELAYYNIKKKQYQFRKLTEDMEIAGITGNIAVMDGKLVLHAHGTFSDKNFGTTGGHLKSAIVSGACEVFITELEQKLVRKYDEETGLNLISL